MSRSVRGWVPLVAVAAACGSGSLIDVDAMVDVDAAAPDAAVDAAAPDAAIDAQPQPDAGPLGGGVSTLAGSGDTGAADGFRTDALFSNPVNVAVGAEGSIYVADFDNGMIREVTDFGDVTTLTSQAGFARPFGLVVSASGVLFAQTDRNSGLADGGALWSINLTTGCPTLVFDNIGRPRGLAELPDGRLVMSFYMEHVIKIFDPSTPAVAPVVIAGQAGVPGMANDTGTAAQFNVPYDVVLISATEVVVSDQGNNLLRLIDVGTGAVTTLAGDGTAATADGTLLEAKFNAPMGLTIDASGKIFVSEADGHVLRQVSGGVVSTIAGDGNAGFLDNENPLAAKFYGLEGIDARPDGTLLYIADGNRGESINPYNRVRRLTLP